MALAPVPAAASMPMPSGITSASGSDFIGRRSKDGNQRILNNSLMEGVTADAEISFDSAMALNGSCNWRRWKNSLRNPIIQGQKENIGNQGSEKKNKNWFNMSAGFSDAVGGGAANDPLQQTWAQKSSPCLLPENWKGHGMGGE